MAVTNNIKIRILDSYMNKSFLNMTTSDIIRFEKCSTLQNIILWYIIIEIALRFAVFEARKCS